MNKNTQSISTPSWLAFAAGSLRAAQHRRTPSHARHKMDDDPVNELLGAPDPLPPIIDLREEWSTLNGTAEVAFTEKRNDNVGTNREMLATLRLCATFENYERATDMCVPSSIAVLHVGHPDWILPSTRALQDLLPEHALFYDPDERNAGDLVVLAPQPGENLGVTKDATKFAKIIAEALTRDTPILMITAGHRALPDTIMRILPPAIRLEPLEPDMVLAMLHLRFDDGDAGWHDKLRDALPDNAMLARLGLEPLNAAFRAATGSDVVEILTEQATALVPKNAPTLDQVADDSEASRLARQMVADLHLWANGDLTWSDCQHSLLMFGKPGTGKTFLARAMGGSSGVPIIMSSLARWQANGHLGDFLKAMIDTCNEAIAAAPCILFIDEIDAAGSRDSGERQNSSYRRQAINGLLEQIDNLMRAEGVILVGACNDVTALDPAIVRPGRFDNIVEVPLPGRAAVAAIVERQLGKDLEASDLDKLTLAAIGATPAVIDGAIRAARSDTRFLGRSLEVNDVIARLNNGEAVDRALLWRIAIHECGHAIVAVDRDLGTLRRVRLGRQDGNTEMIHDPGAGLLGDHRDMLSYTLGGRAAESVIFGSIGSGSGGANLTCDLAFATRHALAIETSYGFGKSGLIWSNTEPDPSIEDPVLRATVGETLNKAEANAKRILENHRVLLLEMAKVLMRQRILEGSDLQLWIDRIRGDLPWDPEDPSGRRKAAEDASLFGMGDVIDFAAHKPQAP